MKLTEFAPASAIPLVKIQSEGDVAANPAQLLLRTPHTPPTLRYLTLPFPPQSPPNLSKPPETGGLSQTWTRVSFPSFWGGGGGSNTYLESSIASGLFYDHGLDWIPRPSLRRSLQLALVA